MEPLSALSVASAVIQIVDFSSKVLSRTREIYSSADGVMEENAFLEDATSNLSELSAELLEELAKPGPGYFSKATVTGKKTADAQLVQLAKDSRTVAHGLITELEKLKRKQDGGKRSALLQGFRSVYEQKKISALTYQLDLIRKEIDTALLLSLRKRIGQFPEHTIESGNNSQKVELLSSLQSHDWKPTDSGQMMAFSDSLLSSIDEDIEQRFCNMILARLHFSDMPERYEAISKAHKNTFQWLFDEDPQHAENMDWDSFIHWLSRTDGSNAYWVAGKPGSGKSTLMKYLFDDERTTAHLQPWTAGRPIVKAGFFFWNSGTAMQMSRMGLLQTLLHSALSEDKETILQLFAHRWQKFIAFGGGRQPFTWAELRHAFESLITQPITPRTFFFMIDGLDEFDGDPKDLTDLVLGASKHSHVKICVASRPWLKFADSFEGRPSLLLERLTKQDIRHYVTFSFENNKHYTRASKLDPDKAARLVTDITDKAFGVFLWVYLVVRSLIEGLSNADRMSDLSARLEALPPGLEQLFDKLMKSLEPEYHKHACQLFRLVMAREHPLLLELWFADNEDHNSAMINEIKPLSPDEIMDRLETMNRRLISRCRCFLEVEFWHEDANISLSDKSYVRFIHRTAKDFLQSGHMWATILNATGGDKFDPEQHWANAFMGILKAVDNDPDEKWKTFIQCNEYAVRLEKRLGICQVDYLDEIHRTAMQVVEYHRDSKYVRRVGFDSIRKPPRIQTFLDFAVWLNMAGYVEARAREVERSELMHAILFKNILWSGQAHEFVFEDNSELVRIAFNKDRRAVNEALSNALRINSKESRRGRWERTKRKFFHKRGAASKVDLTNDKV